MAEQSFDPLLRPETMDLSWASFGWASFSSSAPQRRWEQGVWRRMRMEGCGGRGRGAEDRELGQWALK